MNAFTKMDAAKLVVLKLNGSVIGEKKIKLTQAHAKAVISSAFEEMAEALRLGRKVEIRDFGVFEPKMGKPRVGRNPSRPELGDIRIPPKQTVRFHMGKGLRRTIRQHNTVKVKPVLTAEPVED